MTDYIAVSISGRVVYWPLREQQAALMAQAFVSMFGPAREDAPS